MAVGGDEGDCCPQGDREGRGGSGLGRGYAVTGEGGVVMSFREAVQKDNI